MQAERQKPAGILEKVMANMKGNHCRLIIVVALLAISMKPCAPTRTYRGINIELHEEPEVPRKQCRQVLTAIEATLTSASAALHTALDGRYYFEDFNIYLPATWDDECIPQDSQTDGRQANHSDVPMRKSSGSVGGYSDVVVSSGRGRHGEPMWTQQFGPCGTPALRIYASYDGLTELLHASAGKAFVREWAKYRYGVFDEVGRSGDRVQPKCYRHSGREARRQTGCADQLIDDDDNGQRENAICAQTEGEALVSPLARTSLMFAPTGEGVSMFCDSGNHNRYAPTPHNHLCGRRSTLDVIMAHEDFAQGVAHFTHAVAVVDTTPRFNYRRRSVTRYVVIVDDSLDSAVRESWSFLRSAFRKWLLYDLLANTEVGVVLASGRDASKTLGLTPLANDTSRDRVASFLPYTPTDIRQTICVECAVAAALELLDRRQSAKGPAAHVILIVAPGMAEAAAEQEAVERQVRGCANPVRLATINYPTVLAGRQPLDALADNDRVSFTVGEQKYNSERSYLTGYVRLTNVLLHVAAHFFERTGPGHAPLEVHRREIRGSDELDVRGEFYLDASYGLPAGFFVYTHSVEAPLLQAMRLVAPSGVVVEARSDQRMPVKQLTLLTTLNETGVWSYEVARYPGNPQPHVVQVLATPRLHDRIQVESRVVSRGAYFLLYTDITRGQRGEALASSAAAAINATVTITHRLGWQNSTETEMVLALFDDGNGDVDILAGDGIYSRKVKAHAAGIYNFEFLTVGSSSHAKPHQRFSRYSPIYTRHLAAVTSTTSSSSSSAGQILDFVCGGVTAGQFNCTWSTHGGREVVGHELRYAFNVEDIVDHFSQADLLTELSSAEDSTSYRYLHDVATTPFLSGETIFIALRAKLKGKSTTQTPISNIAEVFIAAPMPNTTTPTATSSDPGGDSHVPLTDATPTPSINGSAAVEPSEKALPFGLSQLGLHLLAACFALCFIFLSILLCCYIRSASWCKLAKKREEEELGQHAPNEAADESCRRETTASVHTSLSVLEVKLPDHHRIGIPVFAEPEYQSNQFPDAQHYGLNNSFYSGMNIISTTAFDGDRGGGGGDWFASQHLECSGPPVPPLPYPLLQLSTPHESDFSLQHHRLPPPPPPPPSLPAQHCQQQQQMMPIEPCLTAVMDPRRCRNVTMV